MDDGRFEYLRNITLKIIINSVIVFCLEPQAHCQGDSCHGQGDAERKLCHEFTQGQFHPMFRIRIYCADPDFNPDPSINK
jgi:hypothetical protein